MTHVGEGEQTVKDVATRSGLGGMGTLLHVSLPSWELLSLCWPATAKKEPDAVEDLLGGGRPRGAPSCLPPTHAKKKKTEARKKVPRAHARTHARPQARPSPAPSSAPGRGRKGRAGEPASLPAPSRHAACEESWAVIAREPLATATASAPTARQGGHIAVTTTTLLVTPPPTSFVIVIKVPVQPQIFTTCRRTQHFLSVNPPNE